MAVHVLGGGALGRLFAVSLRARGVPVSLIVRRPPSEPSLDITLRQSFSASETSKEQTHAVAVESAQGTTEPISTLLVSTKAFDATNAITQVLPRLSSESVVLLVNNGCLALADELEERFPGCSTSPLEAAPMLDVSEARLSPHQQQSPFTLVLGTTTHGAFCPKETSAQGGEVVVHAGFGRVWFGLPAMAPHASAQAPAAASPNNQRAAGATTRGIDATAARAAVAVVKRAEQSVNLIARSGLLGNDADAVGLDPFIEQRLWEKLCANAVLNPLTALWRCENGAVLARSDGRALANAIASEVAAVARARAEEKVTTTSCDDAVLALQSSMDPHSLVPFSNDPLSAEALCAFVEACAAENAKNKSSMLIDVTMGRRTEMAYLGGWVAREGQRLRVDTPINEALTKAIQRAEAGEDCANLEFIV